MRKYLLDLMIFAVFLSFTACDDKKEKIVGFWKKDGENIVYHFDTNGNLTEIRLKGEIHKGRYMFTDNDTLLLQSPGFSSKSYAGGVNIVMEDTELYLDSPSDFTVNAIYKRIDEKEFKPTYDTVVYKDTLRRAEKALSDLQKTLHDYRVENGRYPYKSGNEGWNEIATKLTADTVSSLCEQAWFFSEGWQYKIAVKLLSEKPTYLSTESIHLYNIKKSDNLPAWVSQKKEQMSVLP